MFANIAATAAVLFFMMALTGWIADSTRSVFAPVKTWVAITFGVGVIGFFGSGALWVISIIWGI